MPCLFKGGRKLPACSGFSRLGGCAVRKNIKTRCKALVQDGGGRRTWQKDSRQVVMRGKCSARKIFKGGAAVICVAHLQAAGMTPGICALARSIIVLKEVDEKPFRKSRRDPSSRFLFVLHV